MKLSSPPRRGGVSGIGRFRMSWAVASSRFCFGYDTHLLADVKLPQRGEQAQWDRGVAEFHGTQRVRRSVEVARAAIQA